MNFFRVKHETANEQNTLIALLFLRPPLNSFLLLNTKCGLLVVRITQLVDI